MQWTIDEEELGKLVKKSGITRRMLEEITKGSWRDMFLSPNMAAYIKIIGLLEDNDSK